MLINVFTHYDKPVGPQGLAGLVSSISGMVERERENPTIVPLIGYVCVTGLGVTCGHYAGMWLGYFIEHL